MSSKMRSNFYGVRLMLTAKAIIVATVINLKIFVNAMGTGLDFLINIIIV
jgi:hypothetical protein